MIQKRNCILVYSDMNTWIDFCMLFMQKPNKYNLPNGILPITNGRYSARYGGNHIGNFDTLEEATAAHEREKRKAIRQVAEEYKQVIPDKVYKALLAW